MEFLYLAKIVREHMSLSISNNPLTWKDCKGNVIYFLKIMNDLPN